MKTLKKLFSVSAIVALLGTLAPMYAFGATYTDELEDAYAYARANGVTTKNTIDEADMYGSLTRIAMAKMIANYATSVLGLKADTSRKCTFSDVSTTLDAEYGNGVTNACQLGLMGIDDNGNVKATFDPKGTVTRAQFATALSRAISQAEDGEAIANGNPYYRTHIAYLNGKGIVKSEAEYDVNSVEKRGYVMLMMMRADKDYKPSEGCTTEQIVACALEDDTAACLAKCSGNENPEEPTGNGYVTVRGKAASTQEVAFNAVNKNVGTMTLKAGEYDTTVSSVVIGHNGLGDATAVSVQLFQNGVAVTSQKNISKSSQQVTLKLSPAIVMKANSSMTFDVVASLSGASNETHNFTVEAVNVANGKAEGTPVSLGTLKTTSYEAGKVTAKLSSTASLKAGDTNKTIYTIKLTPNKKGTINGVTITKQAGNEDFDELVSNVKAYYNDEVIGNVKVTDEKIVISNLNIERTAGQSATIDLRGDCIYVGGSVVTTGQIELNDVLAVEANTSENMGNVASEKIGFTVAGADLKLTNKTTKEQTVVPGASDVELLNVQVTSKTELNVNDYTIKFTAPATVDFNNFVDKIVTVYVDGEDYEMNTGTLNLAGKKNEFAVSSTPVTIRVVANFVEEATGTNYTMQLALNTAKSTDGNDNITIGKSVAGHTTKLQAASATVKTATKSAPVTESLFANKNQEVARFAIKAASDDITVRTLDLTATATSGATLEELKNLFDGNLSLVNVENDTEIDATFDVDALASGAIAIKDMNLSVAKDSTVNVKVMANIAAIDDVMDGNVNLTVTGGTFKTSTTAAQPITVGTLTTKTYTFRATAPEITLAKTSDNMFEVTIKNLNDTGIVYDDLKYRVRTDVANVDFSGTVCLVSDVNIISCEDSAVLSSGSFATVLTNENWPETSGSLSENDEVTYYILIDGTSIEPSVLRAEISSLTYNGKAERYNVSRLLNE